MDTNCISPLLVTLVASSAMSVASCASTPERVVKRPPPRTAPVAWTDADTRRLANTAFGKCMNKSWFTTFEKTNGRPANVVSEIDSLTPLADVDESVFGDEAKQQITNAAHAKLADGDGDVTAKASIFENRGVIERTIRVVIDVTARTGGKRICSGTIENRRRL